MKKIIILVITLIVTFVGYGQQKTVRLKKRLGSLSQEIFNYDTAFPAVFVKEEFLKKRIHGAKLSLLVFTYGDKIDTFFQYHYVDRPMTYKAGQKFTLYKRNNYINQNILSLGKPKYSFRIDPID